MPELKEAIASHIAGPDSISDECPFDCGKKCTAKNKLSRNSQFGPSIEAGSPTICFRREGNGDIVGDKRNTHPRRKPAEKKEFPNDWGWAAHHLLPVSTLRKHGLADLMDSDGHVSCDAGYDVNGTPNGVWLVGSSRMQSALKSPGVEEYVRATMKRVGIGASPKKSAYSALSRDAKKNTGDFLGFRSHLFATMISYRRQFHDSHGSYDDFVESALNKVWTNLIKSRLKCLSEKKCKSEQDKPMAPHEVGYRLNQMSSRLRQHLTGDPSTWRNPVFTSQFSKMLAIEVQKG